MSEFLASPKLTGQMQSYTFTCSCGHSHYLGCIDCGEHITVCVKDPCPPKFATYDNDRYPDDPKVHNNETKD